MSKELLQYLPAVMRGYREMQIIMESEQPEITALEANVGVVMDNQFLESAQEYGVARLEAMLRLTPSTGELLEDRKFSVLTKLLERLPYTQRELERQLATLCGEEGYSLEVVHSDYLLVVRIALAERERFSAVESLLRRIVPANMQIDLALMYNQHSMLSAFAHGELRAYRHYDLRNSEVTN